MGRFDKALPLYQRALAIEEKVLGPDHPSGAITLQGLAILYQSMGQFDKALSLNQRALAIYEEVLGSDHPRTATSLNNLAGLYRSMGRPAKALPLYQRALAIREKVLGPDHPDTANSLNNLAGLYGSIGEFDKALPLYQRALAIREKVLGAEHPDTASSLTGLADLYELMSQFDKALPLYQRALAIWEKVLGPDHPDTASSLNNLAGLYQLIGQFDKALALYQRALAIDEKALGADHPNTATDLNNLAEVYISMGQFAKALPLYQRALAIREKVLGPDHPDTASSLNNLAGFYVSIGQFNKALSLYQRALLLVSKVAVTDVRGEHGVLKYVRVFAGNLGFLLERWPAGPRIDEAIVYCKLSVNAGQRMRRGAAGLDRSLRESFTQTISGAYQRLAKLLVLRGRFSEAEHVLLLLKESELQEFVRRNGDDASSLQPLRWTEAEQEFATRLDELAGELSQQLGVVAGLRERIKRGELTDDTPEYRKAWSALDRLIEKESAALSELQGRLVKKAEQERVEGTDRALHVRSELANRQAAFQDDDNLKSLRLPTTAAITWLPDARGLTVLVTTADVTRAVPVEITEEQINQAAGALRQAIQTRSDYLKPARDLYRWLIEPVNKLLSGSNPKVTHLMLNAIGALRDVPFAALVNPDDGKHLIERYALSLITAQTVGNLTQPPIQRWELAALGASIAHPDFGNIPLPAVREELCGIVNDKTCQGIIRGRRYENLTFSREELTHLLGPANSTSPAKALHLATHYSVEKSRLLLGSNEVLALDELVKMDLRLGKYDLLTLSACDSATGGAGVESLAGLLQQHGAKAVLATLWSVQDEGTAKLMVEFYRHRGQQRQGTKAAALQYAQLALLRGDIKSTDPKLDLRHPYFWAPFVLMGNWM